MRTSAARDSKRSPDTGDLLVQISWLRGALIGWPLRALDDLLRDAAEHADEHRSIVGSDRYAVRQLLLRMDVVTVVRL